MTEIVQLEMPETAKDAVEPHAVAANVAFVEMRSSLIFRFDIPSITRRHTVYKKFRTRSISAVTAQLSQPCRQTMTTKLRRTTRLVALLIFERRTIGTFSIERRECQ
jgi:hypothetical protein